ncbi:MAG: competence/damage-inducible protein A [Chloroflexi bacterium]|nr:competence/damage-inducible protein A [Chloroflexota bacterium]
MDPESDGPSAELLSIGSELLAGETIDTNAAFLGSALARLGIPLSGIRTLPDDGAVIASAFAEARGRVALVVATGGLGPTHDDVTREGLSGALGEELVADPALEAPLRERFAALGTMPESNLRQALRVPSAEALANPIGSAPGWWVDRDGSVVVLMPGVPSEMRRMWDEQVVPRLRARFALRPVHARTVKTFGVGESTLAEMVGDLLTAPGAGLEAGIYAHDDGVHLRFWTRGDSSALEAPVARAVARLGDHVYGTDEADLASQALAALGHAGATTVASWEADTRGTLLSILSSAEPAAGAARFIGGALDAGATAIPVADAVIQLSLLATDAHGRSRVRVSVAGAVSLPTVEVRVHGSGVQRARRAAFAALDQVRGAFFA